MCYFYIGIFDDSRGLFKYMNTKNNERVLHTFIEHKFVVVFITYYTFDVGLRDFWRFTLGTILYKKVVSIM